MMEILLKKNLNLYCNRMLHKCKKWSSNCCTLFSKVFKTFPIPNSFVWPSVDWKININFSNWRIKWGQMSGKVGCSAKYPSRVKVSKTVGKHKILNVCKSQGCLKNIPILIKCKSQGCKEFRIKWEQANLNISKNHNEIFWNPLNEFQKSEMHFQGPALQGRCSLLLMMITAVLLPNQLPATFYKSEMSFHLNSWGGCGDSKQMV